MIWRGFFWQYLITFRCLILNCDLDPAHAKYSDAFNITNDFAKFAIPSGKLSQCYEYVNKSSNDTVSQNISKKFNLGKQYSDELGL